MKGGFFRKCRTDKSMSDEIFTGGDIVTVVDDDGKEHVFEELDRIETDNGNKYVALLPVYDDDIEILEENGENYLIQIEDENEFNEIGNIIEDRLIEKYEKEDEADE